MDKTRCPTCQSDHPSIRRIGDFENADAAGIQCPDLWHSERCKMCGSTLRAERLCYVKHGHVPAREECDSCPGLWHLVEPQLREELTSITDRAQKYHAERQKLYVEAERLREERDELHNEVGRLAMEVNRLRKERDELKKIAEDAL